MRSSSRLLCAAGAGIASSGVGLAQDAPAELLPLDIGAKAASVDPASVAGGYRVKSAYVGPFGERPLVDTPYSIDAVPLDLVKNQHLLSVREAFRLIPSVQGENIRPQTRGMQAAWCRTHASMGSTSRRRPIIRWSSSSASRS